MERYLYKLNKNKSQIGFIKKGNSSREPQVKGADDQLPFFPIFRSTLSSHSAPRTPVGWRADPPAPGFGDNGFLRVAWVKYRNQT